MKFLLWFEPERNICTTKIPSEHPEWFFKLDGNDSWLINLGCEDALEYIINTVSEKIEELHISCYRQDFNIITALSYWDSCEEPGRKGINQIKHINGLYRFQDALLERFPNLIIDDCSGGGRRIDIEMVRRSVPLWRSDVQCVWNSNPSSAQEHNCGIHWYLPYSGTGAGNVTGDTYRLRSYYSSAMQANYWGYEDWEFNPEDAGWVRKMNEEYKRLRPYFSCDYYPLTCVPIDEQVWCAWQFDRPEQKDGMIMAFRRPESPYPEAAFRLGGMKNASAWEFEDLDTGETFVLKAEMLRQDFVIRLPEKRSSKVYI